ncbi:formimidoylglutamate deiminase [Pelagovum pacificum]|uniref:Formimidoylglutamate deiminase n=1 Tax=Pelagovum pacificum TaxID=2588711 RepID=A0A5C5GD30_9RHOB|nr:formimidoylglutamate deiminase [Pelagovum pacificum]QQA44225.1 formimidoylglutamate deiminase [Pelagovum pacificum]TNY32653.1 formimidoylglutamate deiminase [Pelagovum pacificum]
MIFARQALLPEGWTRDVRVCVTDGAISDVTPGAVASAGDVRVDALVPGMANLHSHTFQRGFSGMTERRGQGRESFWTWRDLMYRFALSLDPDGVEALALLCHVEMLEAGFTRVGEFHYLHHAPDGRPYDDPAELSARIFAAAEHSGIALTHLPVFYAHAGFGGQDPEAGQRRFLHDPEPFLALVEACDAFATRSGDRVGWAPHSLRAVTAEELSHLCGALQGRITHIHVAEQVKEVEDCLAFSGARPVDWLFDHVDVGADWCLIHATHLSDEERMRLARSGAVAGLCPVTEANLGDGLFPAERFLAEGGRIGIGTDSNVRIDVAEELRTLEYGQRLFHRARNVLAAEGSSTGRRLFDAACAGGAQALDAPPAVLAPGAPADVVGLSDPMDSTGDALLDRWVFGRDVAVTDVWVAGRHLVREGRHPLRGAAVAGARDAMKRVLS